MNQEQLPVNQAINELETAVTSEADRAQLSAWRAEAARERQEAEAGMGELPTLVETPDGVVITEQERREAVERGDNPSGPYDGGRRA